MIQFSYFKYKLYPQAALGAIANDQPRDGALLQIQWPDKKIGYADLFPWPELGDYPLDRQLFELQEGRITPLVEQAIWLGRKDANLRAKKVNALTEAPRIKNHFLITDCTKVTDENLSEIRTAGFSTLKIKVGRQLHEEVRWVQRILEQFQFQIRLDFNSSMDFSSYERFMSFFNAILRQKIEFVEDPFPYDAEAWSEASQFAPLALDQEYDKVQWDTLTGRPPFQVLVIKPARQDVDKALKHALAHELKIVITSSMDHPVGVAHAIRVAADLKKDYGTQILECGCYSHRAYRANEFSTAMIFQGPYLTQIAGTGIGFDDLLKVLPWTLIKAK
ncbi:MAG: hypothetical protein BroJett040_04630 [Oligoflexia bacterium]|nr:MAG: hypothetical protein BroJett040_04630 [Oligoflexia bacterium]